MSRHDEIELARLKFLEEEVPALERQGKLSSFRKEFTCFRLFSSPWGAPELRKVIINRKGRIRPDSIWHRHSPDAAEFQERSRQFTSSLASQGLRLGLPDFRILIANLVAHIEGRPKEKHKKSAKLLKGFSREYDELHGDAATTYSWEQIPTEEQMAAREIAKDLHSVLEGLQAPVLPEELIKPR